METATTKRQASILGFIEEHTERGDCKCGKCFDLAGIPDPVGHTADVVFFKVAKVGNPDAAEFIRLSREHVGAFGPCDPFDGQEHGYMELGGWLGDQGEALRWMALGSLLGVLSLMTPKNMLPGCDDAFALQVAGMGMVTIKSIDPQ